MKVIIAGSRDYFNSKIIYDAIAESGFNISEVICGCARGVDTVGRIWAIENNVPVKLFEPDWKGKGKIAGLLRNEDMAKYADALIAIRKNYSTGTSDMIIKAKNHGLKVFVKDV